MVLLDLEEEEVSDFLPIDGPIRILPWKAGHSIAVNRLGIFLAGGRECALRPMADAFNATKEWTNPCDENEDCDCGVREPNHLVRHSVTACPSCGFPIEDQGAEKCVSCLNPEPEPTVKEEPKKSQMEEWM